MAHEALIPPAETPVLTLDQWFDLPEDAEGELVDGRLEEEEMPDFVHEFLVILLGQLFAEWAVPRGGAVGASDAKLAVTETRGRKPDLTVFLPGRPLPPRRGLIRTPPDIAVEILSPKPRDTRRDRVQKMSEYAAFGVSFYWLVDPQLGTVEIFELGSDGRYVVALSASSGTVDPVPGCEGLAFDLDALWEKVERLPSQPED